MWNIFENRLWRKCWFVMLWKLFHQIKFNEPFFFCTTLSFDFPIHTYTHSLLHKDQRRKTERRRRKNPFMFCSFSSTNKLFWGYFPFQKHTVHSKAINFPVFLFHTLKYILLFLSTFKLILQNKLNKLYSYTYVQHITHKE